MSAPGSKSFGEATPAMAREPKYIGWIRCGFGPWKVAAQGDAPELIERDLMEVARQLDRIPPGSDWVILPRGVKPVEET